MTGKEKVIDYCNKMLEEINEQHLVNCREVRYLLKNNDKNNFVGFCPSSYGLDDYKGLCEIGKDKTLTLEDHAHQCKTCWEIALR